MVDNLSTARSATWLPSLALDLYSPIVKLFSTKAKNHKQAVVLNIRWYVPNAQNGVWKMADSNAVALAGRLCFVCERLSAFRCIKRVIAHKRKFWIAGYI